MAIGNTVSSVQLNQELVQLIVRWRDVARDTSNLQQQVTQAGHAGLIAAGFSDPDATTFANVLSYLATNAGVFQGTTAQTPAFDFQNVTASYVLGN